MVGVDGGACEVDGVARVVEVVGLGSFGVTTRVDDVAVGCVDEVVTRMGSSGGADHGSAGRWNEPGAAMALLTLATPANTTEMEAIVATLHSVTRRRRWFTWGDVPSCASRLG